MSNELFQHTDGGFYRYRGLSKSSVDQSQWVVYEHVWPFLPTGRAEFWHRPVEEWESRFTRVSEEVLVCAMQSDRQIAQDAITARRTARKEKEYKVRDPR